MFLSAELRSKNIAEYILYMFHTEDMIRALDFDEQKIEKYISSSYSNTNEALEWHKDLCEMMMYEKVKEKGHIHVVRNQINELENFLTKIKENNDEEFNSAYSVIGPVFEEIRSRNSNEALTGVAEMALNVMYWYMSQKIAGKTITEEQTEQVRNISVFLSVLSSRFKKFESGEYELS